MNKIVAESERCGKKKTKKRSPRLE